MNYAFFDSLSRPEAEDYLHAFLTEIALGFDEMAARAAADGLVLDYSIQTIAPLMLWALPQLKTVPLPEDLNVSAWIRQTKEYADGLYDFTGSTRILVLRSAYYFGESFVREFPQLGWGVGNQDYAEKHMPVVWGFKSRLELSPLLVSENLYRRVISDGSKSHSFATAVEYWRRNVEI